MIFMRQPTKIYKLKTSSTNCPSVLNNGHISHSKETIFFKEAKIEEKETKSKAQFFFTVKNRITIERFYKKKSHVSITDV